MYGTVYLMLESQILLSHVKLHATFFLPVTTLIMIVAHGCSVCEEQ